MRVALAGEAMKGTDFGFVVKAVWQKNYCDNTQKNASQQLDESLLSLYPAFRFCGAIRLHCGAR
jgi:hypothetical protein